MMLYTYPIVVVHKSNITFIVLPRSKNTTKHPFANSDSSVAKVTAWNMVDRFFLKRQRDAHRPEPGAITILSGPSSCGKTSLLFQFAMNSASECSSSNRKVVFICNRRRLETKPPYLSQAYRSLSFEAALYFVLYLIILRSLTLSMYGYQNFQGIDPSSDIFQRIKMKYVNDEDGIKKYFAAFHLNDTFPAAVIVDDFGDFFDERSCQERYGNTRGRDLAMLRTLALCHNSIIHANERGPCKLLLSDTHHGDSDSPRLLFIYRRWIPTIFTIKGDGAGSFLLKCNKYSGNGKSRSTRTAKYSIAFQYLFLEGITDEQ